jgi:hypothetical protein
MIAKTGLSGHIGNVWKMMQRANCEDGILSDCIKARSLQDLSQEVMEEMEGDRSPKYPNYYREYGKAIAIVRINHEIPIDGIAGLKAEDVQDIESGYLYPTSLPLACYAESLGLSLDSFLDKVTANVDVLKAMEAIA